MTTEINLAKYGDQFHDRLGYERRGSNHIHLWQKTGFVRSTLTGPAYRIPIYNYDYIASVPHAVLELSVSSLKPEVAKMVVERELAGLRFARNENALGMTRFVLGELYGHSVVGDMSLEQMVAHVQSDNQTHATPYRWYSPSPIDWLVLAELGICVEYLSGTRFKWCTKERALELAQVSLRYAEYEQGLVSIIKSFGS